MPEKGLISCEKEGEKKWFPNLSAREGETSSRREKGVGHPWEENGGSKVGAMCRTYSGRKKPTRWPVGREGRAG